MKIKVGLGFDTHRFTQGDHIIIGGVKIPHSKSILAHSDGDVLLHALIDALLGATGQGDIGSWFPDNDPTYSGADSAVMLKQVLDSVHQNGYIVNNVDATVIAEKPKLRTHIDAIKNNVAALLNISAGDVSIKATTNEKMGHLGQQQGLAAHVVVLIITRP